MSTPSPGLGVVVLAVLGAGLALGAVRLAYDTGRAVVCAAICEPDPARVESAPPYCVCDPTTPTEAR